MPLVISRTGFNGLPIVYDKPRFHEYIPFEGFVAGVQTEIVDECVGIYDKWGVLIYEWPEDSEPTREEVQAEVFKYLKNIGRNVF